MIRHYFVTLFLFTISFWALSQTFDTTRINEMRAEFLKGNLKKAEVNPNDFIVENEKNIKLKKNTFNKTCQFNYKNFTFYFEYESFVNKLNSSRSIPANLASIKKYNFRNDSIQINDYLKKAADENFIIDYLIELIEEKKLNAYDNVGKKIEKVTLKNGVKETETILWKVTLFYIDSSYLFHRQINVCTSKHD